MPSSVTFIWMKKLCIVLLFSIAIIIIANAQNYKKFRVGLGTGTTLSFNSGYGYEPGILFTIEPAYHLSGELYIGLRFEEAITDLESVDLESGSIYSGSVNFQYYLNTNKLRPFLGGGFGLYNSAILFPGGITNFGFYPRIGFDLGDFSLTIDNNFIPTSTRQGKTMIYYIGIIVVGFFGGSGNDIF